MAQTYSGGPVPLRKELATGKSLKEAEAAACGGSKSSKGGAKNTK